MLFKTREHTNATLLKHLLINHTQCPDKDLCPRNPKEWETFIGMSYRNRLVTLLYHFVDCKTCKSSVPRMIKGMIQQHYTETLIRYENYKKIRRKIKLFIRKTGIPLILLKDIDEKTVKKYYPPHYVPLKFDIDIFGKYKDLPKLRKFIAQIDYNPKGYHYGSPSKPIPQYKFSLKDKKSLFPQIEFRYKAFTIFPTKKNILNRENIDEFTREIWQNVHFPGGNFLVVPFEYQFIYHALIAYFEDGCRGLNNLYRVWLLSKNQNNIYWDKIEKISQKYSSINIEKVIRMLTDREFSFTEKILIPNSISKKCALRIISLDYICRAKLPNDKDFGNWKDGYIYFLTRGLLAEEPFWQKILFFCHPKRVLFLLWELLA